MNTVQAIEEIIKETNKKVAETQQQIKYADERYRRKKAFIAGAVFGVVAPVIVSTAVKYLRG